MEELGVTYLRTGLSWADALRPGGVSWLDRQMKALEKFQVTATFCFTPEERGVAAHHTSPPKNPEEFAEFCARMTRRYGT
jgi:beta-xylosidase